MRDLRYTSLSEFGIDHGFGRGRFCAVREISEQAFHDYWWKETCRFETYLNGTFAREPISVSDNVPSYKEFCIWPEERPPLDELCEACLVYLEREHPDASVVLASPSDFDIGTGRIVLTLKGIWIDQDLLFWLLEKSQSARLVLPGLSEQVGEFEDIDIQEALPWVKSSEGTRVCSQTFWRSLYTHQGLPLIERPDEDESEGYSIGGEIVSRLSERYWILDESKSSEVYVSGSFGKHRVIKVECSRNICDRDFVESVFRIVSGIDGTWAVRFAVYGDLASDNSYLGGIIINQHGDFVIEGHAAS